jgi:predicted acylesterase/phospholipase RssA
MQVSGIPLNTQSSINRNLTLDNLKSQFAKYTSILGSPLKKAFTNTGLSSDFSRLARRLLNKSIGLVLGGGGARGIAQIGILKAFEEAGIPIDMVGGTSIGSMVGGLYSREVDVLGVMARAKGFSGRMTSKLRTLMDLTYPVTSWFTGNLIN